MQPETRAKALRDAKRLGDAGQVHQHGSGQDNEIDVGCLHTKAPRLPPECQSHQFAVSQVHKRSLITADVAINAFADTEAAKKDSARRLDSALSPARVTRQPAGLDGMDIRPDQANVLQVIPSETIQNFQRLATSAPTSPCLDKPFPVVYHFHSFTSCIRTAVGLGRNRTQCSPSLRLVLLRFATKSMQLGTT